MDDDQIAVVIKAIPKETLYPAIDQALAFALKNSDKIIQSVVNDTLKQIFTEIAKQVITEKYMTQINQQATDAVANIMKGK